MKLIKTAAFLFQFGLIGLALAVLYLFAVSERSRDEVIEFLAGGETRSESIPAGQAGAAVFSYADAVASSASSVVTIYTSKTVREKLHPLLEDPVFSQFFGDQLERRQRERTETNLGSGVIIGSDGYILTNQHVIDGADEILISLADGRGSQAVLIGEERETDIAILQIPFSDLTGIATQPKSELLVHILDPSRDVVGNYQQYTVVTNQGLVTSGMLASETKTAIEIIDTDAKRHTFLREDIVRLDGSRLSVMPAGFEEQIKPQQMRL